MRSLNEQKGIEISRIEGEIMGRTDQNLGMRNEVQDLELRINREREASSQIADEIARSTAALQDSTR